MLQALSSAQGPTFPPLKAENLNGVTVDMPSGFEGDVNLVLIAFLQKQQADVDTWLKPLPAIAKAHPKLRYYELPTIKGMNRMVRWAEASDNAANAFLLSSSSWSETT